MYDNVIELVMDAKIKLFRSKLNVDDHKTSSTQCDYSCNYKNHVHY